MQSPGAAQVQMQQLVKQNLSRVIHSLAFLPNGEHGVAQHRPLMTMVQVDGVLKRVMTDQLVLKIEHAPPVTTEQSVSDLMVLTLPLQIVPKGLAVVMREHVRTGQLLYHVAQLLRMRAIRMETMAARKDIHVTCRLARCLLNVLCLTGIHRHMIFRVHLVVVRIGGLVAALPAERVHKHVRGVRGRLQVEHA